MDTACAPRIEGLGSWFLRSCFLQVNSNCFRRTNWLSPNRFPSLYQPRQGNNAHNMWISIWFFWLRAQPHFPKLYVLGVTIAGIYAEYYLSNFVQILAENLDFTNFKAAAAINLLDAVNGIFGIIGAILCDASLTLYGMVFLSSTIYCLGLSIIAAENERSGYAISNYASFLWVKKYSSPDVGVSSATTSLVLLGLFLTGVAKLSLVNSSQMLSDENRGTNLRNTNPFTKFIEFVFGDDSAILRYVQSHGYIMVLVFTKYATKTVFIFVSSFLGPSRDSNAGFIYGDKIALWIPAIGLGLVSLITFLCVRSFRKPEEDRQQTPLKHVLRVYIAAFKKRSILCPPDPPTELLYEENHESQLKHTIGFRYLDKAAIIQTAEPREERKQWKLCTVTEVEETKILLRMLPMCLTFLAYGVVKSLGNTIFILQGNITYNRIADGDIGVPIQTLIMMGELSGSITQGLYGLLLSKRFSGLGKMYEPPMKYAIGSVLATFCCTVASWIATDKVDMISLVRTKKDAYLYLLTLTESVFWLIPQFILFGAMSEVTRDGIRGFLHDQLPPSMVRFDSVFTDALTGAGAIFSIAISHALGFSHISHYPAGVYSNRELAKYYRVLTVFSFISLSAYTFIATRYNYKGKNEAPSNLEEQK